MMKNVLFGATLTLLSFNAIATQGCFYGMSEQKALSYEKNKIDAYTLIYDVSACSDETLLLLKSELMKASEDSLSYLQKRYENSQNSFVSAFGSIGYHGETKDRYDLRISRIQSSLALVLSEMNKRSL